MYEEKMQKKTFPMLESNDVQDFCKKKNKHHSAHLPFKVGTNSCERLVKLNKYVSLWGFFKSLFC